MARRGVRRENRDREGELEIPLNANIISILNRRFVKDYLVYLESRERKSYVSEFSQKMLKQLVEAYRCGGELNSLLKSASQYLDELVQGAAQVFPQVLVLNVRLASRLTVACASRHLPIEVSIAWDQILNIPYIPSSGIKGLVRAYFEEHGVRIDGLGPEDLLGSEESIGVLVFFDAYPIMCGELKSLLELDVVTPHYREVEGIISEARSSPVPVLFPVIAPGTIVRMVVASRVALSQESIKKLAVGIRSALGKGVGAKTFVGYGRIRDVELCIHSKQKPSICEKL